MMTKQKLLQEIKLAIDKYSTTAVIGPAFLDLELISFANQAMLQVITNKFTGHNVLQQGFEQSAKRVSDLQGLIATDIVNLQNIGGNQYSFYIDDDNIMGSIPDDCMFIIDLVYHISQNEIFTVELVSHETAKKFTQTVDNCPWVPTPVAVVRENSLVFLCDPYLQTKTGHFCEIRYIKRPTLITSEMDDNSLVYNTLTEEVLYEVINKAAVLILDNIESGRVLTKNELNLNAE